MAKSLIDKVIEKCGSQAEAARRLDVTRANISLIASGKVQLSPELAALCAEIVGEDPYRCAAEAMVLNCKDRNKAERLNRAFHLPRLAGGAAMLLISLALGVSCPDSVSAKSVREHLTVYTLWQLLRRARTRAKDWTRTGFRLSGNALRASGHYLRPQTLARQGIQRWPRQRAEANTSPSATAAGWGGGSA